MAKRLRQLKRDDPDAEIIEHRQVKYLNNRIEADHGPIKRLCRATLKDDPDRVFATPSESRDDLEVIYLIAKHGHMSISEVQKCLQRTILMKSPIEGMLTGNGSDKQ